MEAQDGDLRLIEGGKPRLGESTRETVAGQTGSQQFLGLPHPDKNQGVVVNSAMVPELARWATRLHDRSMRSVISTSQFLDVALETDDQECTHFYPSWK